MDQNYKEKLKYDIEKKAGIEIRGTSSAKLLLKILQEQHIHSISLSTIRRFFEIIPSTKPNKSTLDHFSMYLGYKNYLGYVTYNNSDDLWYNHIQLQEIKFQNDLSAQNIIFLNSSLQSSNFPIFFLYLFESLVYLEKWKMLQKIFSDKRLDLFKLIDYLEISVHKTAYLTYNFIFKIKKPLFFKLVDSLVTETNFRDFIIYRLVHKKSLNYRYGYVLERILKLNPTIRKQEELFINLILSYRAYLNGKNKLPLIKCEDNILQTLPEVLIGRYHGYQLLYAKSVGSTSYFDEVWQNILKIRKTSYKPARYFFEIFQILIISKELERLEELITIFYDDLFDSNHYYSYLESFVYLLGDAFASMKQSNSEGALKTFKLLNIDGIKNDFYQDQYHDYLLLFYKILAYHLAESLEDQKEISQNYLALANQMGFKRFNLKFLKNYFNTFF